MSTGFVTDRRMLLHKCEWDPDHMEVPGRLQVVLDQIEESGLLSQCTIVKSREARRDELRLVHSDDYINLMEASQKLTMAEKETLCSRFEDIYLNDHSWQCALLSAGSAVELTDRVLDGKLRNGFAAIRPPGHHASKDQGCGFCIFNNVAICAKHARARGVRRVLIVDFDVHAGQGTQYSIADDAQIKLVSIHRYEHGNFWPNLPESAVKQDFNNTVNVPLNNVGLGDAQYVAILHSVVLPLVYDFQPELILISAGFDCALGDLDGGMQVSPAGFEYMVGLIAAQQVSTVCLLEGGYFLPSVGQSAVHTLKALISMRPPNVTFETNERLFDSLLEVLTANDTAQLIQRIRTGKKIPIKEPETTRYEGDRSNLFPYQTRGLYPRRPKKVDKDFEERLKYAIRNVEEISQVMDLGYNNRTFRVIQTHDVTVQTEAELRFFYFMILLPLSLTYNVRINGSPMDLNVSHFFEQFNLPKRRRHVSNSFVDQLIQLPFNLP